MGSISDSSRRALTLVQSEALQSQLHAREAPVSEALIASLKLLIAVLASIWERCGQK